MNKIEYHIDHHPDIEDDLFEGFEWYEKQEPGLGKKMILHVEQKLAQIAAMPEAYGAKQKKDYREAKVDNFPYIITYKILAKKRTIFISSILHEKKHPGKKYR